MTSVNQTNYSGKAGYSPLFAVHQRTSSPLQERFVSSVSSRGWTDPRSQSLMQTRPSSERTDVLACRVTGLGEQRHDSRAKDRHSSLSPLLKGVTKRQTMPLSFLPFNAGLRRAYLRPEGGTLLRGSHSINADLWMSGESKGWVTASEPHTWGTGWLTQESSRMETR